jgi:hypothetical protein
MLDVGFYVRSSLAAWTRVNSPCVQEDLPYPPRLCPLRLESIPKRIYPHIPLDCVLFCVLCGGEGVSSVPLAEQSRGCRSPGLRVLALDIQLLCYYNAIGVVSLWNCIDIPLIIVNSTKLVSCIHLKTFSFINKSEHVMHDFSTKGNSYRYARLAACLEYLRNS